MTHRLWRNCLLLGGLLLILSSCARTPRLREGWQGEGRGWFDAEWIRGYSVDGEAVGTLSVSVPRRHLIFFAGEDGFHSSYRIRCVQRSGGRALRAQEWGRSLAVQDYAATRSEEREQHTIQFAIDPKADEDLQLVVSLSVDGSQRAASRILAGGRVRQGRNGLDLGELRLYVERSPQDTLRAAIPLGPGQLPNPRRFAPAGASAFDAATGAPWVFVRVFDLRGEESLRDFPLSVRVEPGRGVAQRDFKMARQGVESGLLIRLDAELFAFGENEIEVRLDADLASSVKVQNLGIDLEDEESWKVHLQQLDGLATEHALERLRSAQPGARRATWMQFWNNLDPTPRDGDNERLREHHRRVHFARRQLRDGMSDTTLSDRGRIYVIHGEPTRVEDVPPRWDDPTAWQIWSYEDLHLVFYFRQIQGGHFRMVGSERA